MAVALLGMRPLCKRIDVSSTLTCLHFNDELFIARFLLSVDSPHRIWREIMASKNVFGTDSQTVIRKVIAKKVKQVGNTNTVNEAGGAAYSLNAENALAQLLVTGTFNNTYYVSGEEQLKKIKELADKCSTDFLAKAAIYGQQVAKMKDTPAYLLATLAARGASSTVEKIFPQVITNQKMLRNFVQIVRSGVTGRKSFGTAVKRAIQTWLTKQRADSLFKGSVGNAPSLADVVNMVHPKPESPEKQAFYAWLLDKKYNVEALPAQVALFERFKKGETTDIPDCDFRMLTPFLTKETWTKVALNMPWNALRMNLNTFARHGVFENDEVVRALNAKLQDREAVKRSNAFPYQILTTVQAIRGTAPAAIHLALEQAMEYATENTPEFNVNGVVVCQDTSGSMNSPVTGTRDGATTTTTCVQVAALMASCVLRKNPNKTYIVPFDTRVHAVTLNPNDSVFVNADKLRRGGGGTDCACALRHLNEKNHKADLVIFVSDNESWYGASRYNWGSGATGMVQEWAAYKIRNPKAKLVCIDLQPNTTTQVPNLPNEVLNVGGFSDSVFEIVANFVNNDSRDFAQVIRDSVSY